MKKNPKLFLEHILECIVLIEEYTRNVTTENFMESVKTEGKWKGISNPGFFIIMLFIGIESRLHFSHGVLRAINY